MISMTGYGSATATHGGYEMTAVISTVNKRNLDISISLPREWQVIEVGVADRVREVVKRGKVSVSVRVERAGTGGGIDWNDDAVAAVLRRLRELAERNSIPFEPNADLLFRVAVSASATVAMPEAESIRDHVDAVVRDGLRELAAMREREGRALAEDLRMRTKQLKTWTDEIKTHAGDVVPRYRDLLHQRLKQAGLDLDINDERVLKEIALFADRCDTTEEITRLKSHLDQLQEALDEQMDPVGRKAEFLIQEINREFNTIGSKANDIRISRFVIECKNELERVREQIQNVE